MQNAQELKEMFSFNEHVITNIEMSKHSFEQQELRFKYENKCYMIEVVSVFNDLLKELGRAPSLKEYAEIYLKKSFHGFKKRVFVKKEDEGWIKSCMIWRCERAYKSYIYELYVKERIKEIYGFENVDIFEHQILDYIMGVDIVAIINDEFHYIHVAKDTIYSKNALKGKKLYKKKFTINDKEFSFKRNFSKHIKLFYKTECFSNLNSLNKRMEKSKKNGNHDDWKSNELITLTKQMIEQEVVSKDFRFISEKGRVLEIDE